MSCKRLTLEKKIEIIKYAERSKLSVRLLADEFAVGKSQIADLLKNKENLLRELENGINIKMKNKKLKTGNESINVVVYHWFCNVRNKGMYLLYLRMYLIMYYF